MKFYQKRSVAVAVLVISVVLSSVWGISKKPAVVAPGGDKLDETLPTAALAQYIIDNADILSKDAEKAIALYDANWDNSFQAIIAVVTDKNMGNLEDAAYDWAYKLELGEDDAILVIDAGTREYKLVASGGFYDFFSSQSPSFVDNCVYEDVQDKDYDDAVLNLFGQTHIYLSRLTQNQSSISSTAKSFIGLLVFLFIIWMLLDLIRWRRYRRRYCMPGMGRPTVIYRPIFWGHRWYAPRPVRPYTPTSHYNDYNHRPPTSGFGGTRPPTSSGFNSHHSSSHSGGFSSHSGGFGGSRGGGFSGSRGGGFGGGRGGGFGGRR